MEKKNGLTKIETYIDNNNDGVLFVKTDAEALAELRDMMALSYKTDPKTLVGKILLLDVEDFELYWVQDFLAAYINTDEFEDDMFIFGRPMTKTKNIKTSNSEFIFGIAKIERQVGFKLTVLGFGWDAEVRYAKVRIGKKIRY